MAASSNKPAPSLYVAIGFATLALVFGVWLYIAIRDGSTAQAAAATAKDESQRALTELRNAQGDMDTLKKVLGTNQPQVVDQQNAANPATVVGEVQRQMGEQGRDQREATLMATLLKIRQALDTAVLERNTAQNALQQAQRELLSLQTRYQGTSDEHDKAKAKAEGDLREQTSKRNEELAAKDREIEQLRTSNNQAQLELEQERDARLKERKQLQDELSRLTQINDRLREELDELKKESFEVADGTVTRVDNSAQTIWIALGHADFLKPRMTFSVYSKDTPGVGRTVADIKGKVEVTQIIDDHLAECKIIEDDRFRPMAPGDFVYTPLWSPGRPERFAVVGVVDLDGDGKSDRDLFRQEMAIRGAEISDEVDDAGERSGTGINESVKYLILGSIPDETTLVSDEDKAKSKKIQENLKNMRSEARLHGVRIVPFNDFLSYIGYKPKRRLYKPGQVQPYNLKSGAASAAVGESSGDRTGTGQVSGAFSGRSKQMAPTGTSSKYFSGGGK